MTVISTTLLALSVSADAFAVSVSKGVSIKRPTIIAALKTGSLFGLTETLAPIIGWLVGKAANSFITSIDHWVAFILLLMVGGKMLYESIHPEVKPQDHNKKHKLSLILTAIGTSIDAMAIGITVAFLDASIITMALSMGLATFVMATSGIMIGHIIGLRGGRIAEATGGICIILIGTKILFEHLGILTL